MESSTGVSGQELERELFLLRKLIEKEKILRFAAAGAQPSDFYICTLSGKTIVYTARARACPRSCLCVDQAHTPLPSLSGT